MDEWNRPTDHNIWTEAMKIKCGEAAANSYFVNERGHFFNDCEQVKCEDKIFLCKKVMEDDLLHATIDQIKRALPYNIWNRAMLSETIVCEMRSGVSRPDLYEFFYKVNQGMFTAEKYTELLADIEMADAIHLQPMLYAIAVVSGCHIFLAIPENGTLTPYTFGPEETYNADRVLYIGFENNRFWSLYPCK